MAPADSFGSGSDGIAPTASVIDMKGTLTALRREAAPATTEHIFNIRTAGTEYVLYSFGRAATTGKTPRELDRCERHALRHYVLGR